MGCHLFPRGGPKQRPPALSAGARKEKRRVAAVAHGSPWIRIRGEASLAGGVEEHRAREVAKGTSGAGEPAVAGATRGKRAAASLEDRGSDRRGSIPQ